MDERTLTKERRRGVNIVFAQTPSHVLADHPVADHQGLPATDGDSHFAHEVIKSGDDSAADVAGFDFFNSLRET